MADAAAELAPHRDAMNICLPLAGDEVIPLPYEESLRRPSERPRRRPCHDPGGARGASGGRSRSRPGAAAKSSTDALIGQPKLKIEKRRHELYGTLGAQGRNSRPDMQLEDLGADATEDDLAAEASAPSTSVVIFQPKRPTRRPLSPPPKNCAPRGSLKMVKLREDVTGTLGVIQRL